MLAVAVGFLAGASRVSSHYCHLCNKNNSNTCNLSNVTIIIDVRVIIVNAIMAGPFLIIN